VLIFRMQRSIAKRGKEDRRLRNRNVTAWWKKKQKKKTSEKKGGPKKAAGYVLRPKPHQRNVGHRKERANGAINHTAAAE